jgi:FixJ family two-component response regulator
VPHQQHPILIVEDDQGMRQAIGRLLKAAGYTTAAFESAEALLQADAAGDACCLVVDIGLPGISGLDLRQQLADAGVNVPVIFITAHDESSTRDLVARTGALAYLPKPFVRKDLLDAVARALSEGGFQ